MKKIIPPDGISVTTYTKHLLLKGIKPLCLTSSFVNPFSPNINIQVHILFTVLHTFLMLLVERFCLKIKAFHHWWSFPLFSWLKCLIKQWHCKEKLDIGYLVKAGLRSSSLSSQTIYEPWFFLHNKERSEKPMNLANHRKTLLLLTLF